MTAISYKTASQGCIRTTAVHTDGRGYFNPGYCYLSFFVFTPHDEDAGIGTISHCFIQHKGGYMGEAPVITDDALKNMSRDQAIAYLLEQEQSESAKGYAPVDDRAQPFRDFLENFGYSEMSCQPLMDAKAGMMAEAVTGMQKNRPVKKLKARKPS